MSELEDINRDLIFGHVMEKWENCRQLLKLIFPEKRFERIRVTPQKPINQLLKERKVRFDIWAVDEEGTQYDVEMQVKDEKNLGRLKSLIRLLLRL